jgi:hypothetical protein
MSPVSTGKWNLRPRELARVVDTVRKAGLAVTGVTISNKGDITVATGGQADGGNAPSPWEQTVADLENDRPASNSKSSKSQPARTPR